MLAPEAGGKVHVSSLDGFLFVSIRKPHDQSNLGEKGFILAYISETESFMVGKAW